MIQDLLRVSAPSLQGGQRSCRLFPATEASAGGGGGGSLGLGVEIFNALVNGGVGHVFLKQFRDCSRPDHPCYQAVCKTDTVPGRFRGGARLDAKAYRIFIENMASERLLDYLRKSASEGRQGITPDFAYWMDVDAELTTGRVIANAFETEYVPDRTKPAATGRDKPRRVRRSREPVL